jgi:trk system potassium uptake protein TrkH
LFESTSGITTTGASIYNNVEALPSSIIIWRFILHLIGGVGIVAISIVALPSMKAGGMQLFNTENSDKSQKIMPRVSQIARYFVGLYFTMILVFSILLYSSGMSYIDAVCHSVSAISTGGFSTKNTGINYFNSRSIEIILAIAMFIGGLTFIEFIKCIRGEFISFYKNKQTKAYINSTLVILIFFITILFISDRTNISAKNVSSCLFDVISSITTTGFNLHTEVFLGSFFKIIMIILACVGGCSGSTTGGIKFFRIQILYSVLKKHIQHILRPFDASLSKYYSQRTRDSLMISVVSFFTMLAVVFIISLVFMCIFNGQKMTANIASVYSCIFNIGRPMGFSFSDFGGPEKVVLIIDMITGRLEIIPLFVICNRIFWKK